MSVMIYFLYGPDSYRRQEKLREIITAYRAKHAYADMHVLDCDDGGDAWAEAIDFSNQPSMFSSSKVLVVRESGAIKEKEWISFLKKNIATDSVFIFISDSEKPLKAFSFLLDSPHKMTFPELFGKTLETFIQKEGKKRNVVFPRATLSVFVRLLEQSDNTSWRAVSEIERFSLLGYVSVSLEDFHTHSLLSAKSTVYEETKKMLRAKTYAEKLGLFEKLLLEREAPSYIFNSLSFQSGGCDALLLADYDVSVKRGALEYEEAILSFLFQK